MTASSRSRSGWTRHGSRPKTTLLCRPSRRPVASATEHELNYIGQPEVRRRLLAGDVGPTTPQLLAHGLASLKDRVGTSDDMAQSLTIDGSGMEAISASGVAPYASASASSSGRETPSPCSIARKRDALIPVSRVSFT